MKTGKSILKNAVRLSIAIHAYDALQGMSPEDIGLTDEEFDYMTEQAQKIAEKLAGQHPMNFGSVDACIEYFKSLKS